MDDEGSVPQPPSADSGEANTEASAEQAQQFLNLYLLKEFRDFNFTDWFGPPRQVKSPSNAVAEAFRIRPPCIPDPYLFSILALTLSPLYYAKYLESSRMKWSLRDYVLSKLYQFLLVACLEGSTDPSYHKAVPERLTAALNHALPEGSPHLQLLAQLDWRNMIDDYKKGQNVIALARVITKYLPKVETTPVSGPKLATGSKAAVGRIDPFPMPIDAKWEDVCLVLTSEERVQITVGEEIETRNFADMGFGDNRSKGKNAVEAWHLLQSLAANCGKIEKPERFNAQGWPRIEKQVQTIRTRLRAVFRIPDDPFKPFRHRRIYEARFRIMRGGSYNT